MFRRVFWFVMGAVAGVTGVSWVKRRAAEMRGAITVGTLARFVRDSIVSTLRWCRVIADRYGFPADRSGTTVVPGDVTPGSRQPRRHIASRPHKSHR